MYKQEAQELYEDLYHESLTLHRFAQEATAEETRQFLAGQRSGCLRAALILRRYVQGNVSLIAVRHYLRGSVEVETIYELGMRKVFRRVLAYLAPVPRQKKRSV